MYEKKFVKVSFAEVPKCTMASLQLSSV